MIRAIFHFLINVLIIQGLAVVLTGFHVEGLVAASWFIILLTIVNWTILPLIKLFAFPITILTLGLFNLFLNLATIIVVANYVPGVKFDGGPVQTFWLALVVSIALTIGHSLTHLFDTE